MYLLRPLSTYIYRLISLIDIFILKIKGLKIGKNVFIGQNVIIDPVYPWLISIGDFTTITANTVILSHDASLKMPLGYIKVGKVSIGSHSMIGVGSIIMPGITIGNNVIIGAGSIVTTNIPSNVVVCGNPAKVICSIDEYKRKHIENINNTTVTDFENIKNTNLFNVRYNKQLINNISYVKQNK